MGAVRSGRGGTLPSGRENAKKFAKNRAKRNRAKRETERRRRGFRGPAPLFAAFGQERSAASGGGRLQKSIGSEKQRFSPERGIGGRSRKGEEERAETPGKRCTGVRRGKPGRRRGGGPVSGGCAKKRWKAGERGAEITGKRRIWKIDL